jgi:hypothetical protein
MLRAKPVGFALVIVGRDLTIMATADATGADHSFSLIFPQVQAIEIIRPRNRANPIRATVVSRWV